MNPLVALLLLSATCASAADFDLQSALQGAVQTGAAALLPGSVRVDQASQVAKQRTKVDQDGSTAKRRTYEATVLSISDQAGAYLRESGKAALIQAINRQDPKFFRGDVFLVLRASDSKALAHPSGSRFIGKSIADAVDADGKQYGREILDVAHAGGKAWVDFRIFNPVTKVADPMAVYVTTENGLILEVHAIAL